MPWLGTSRCSRLEQPVDPAGCSFENLRDLVFARWRQEEEAWSFRLPGPGEGPRRDSTFRPYSDMGPKRRLNALSANRAIPRPPRDGLRTVLP